MRGIGQEKIHVAPCSFTDLSLCRPAPVREKAVVFLARFVAIKNPLLLVQAIPAILQAHPEVRFYFLGEGALEGEIRHQIGALDVQAQVVVRFDLNPTQVLNRSSIFVSLQEGENYPSQSLLEAMACGNAVVATDVGETWRLVDEQNGKRVAPEPDAVANAVTALFNDPQLAYRQAASRHRVLAEHSPERVFEHISKVYRQAAMGEEVRCRLKSSTLLRV
jgi:glycosyltransferase involved in cell wall biosynthesis